MNIRINFPQEYAAAIGKISTAISRAGGRPYLVGGAVRDLILDPEASIKDVDFEVFDVDSDTLAAVLQSVSDSGASVDLVGKQFGVFKVVVHGIEFDIAQPRTEISIGSGHRDFQVVVDPHLPLDRAVLRRDLTINALMCDPLDGYRVIDLVGGVKDLKKGVLRPTSPAFKEDPLRPLRAVQFASRFLMHASQELIEASRALKSDFTSLSRDRIAIEWDKWAKGPRPDLGLRLLLEIDWAPLFPSINKVLSHADYLGRLEQLSKAFPLSKYSSFARLSLFIADQAIHVYPDDPANATSLASSIVKEVGRPSNPSLLKEAAVLVSAAVNLSHGLAILGSRVPLPREQQFSDFPFDDCTSASLARYLSLQLASSSSFVLKDLLEWYRITDRNSSSLLLVREIEDIAASEGILTSPLVPLVQGRDLIAEGYPQGRAIGKMLRFALEEQIAGRISNKKQGLQLIRATFPRPSKSCPRTNGLKL